jgi:hypothetical protein
MKMATTMYRQKFRINRSNITALPHLPGYVRFRVGGWSITIPEDHEDLEVIEDVGAITAPVESV